LAIESGKTLLHYRLVDKIGEGGMGVVWRAVDSDLGREVAIKILPDILAGDADRLARFEREARLLASLNHPNIAVIHGLHETEGVRFLAMELIQGEDLQHRLSRGPVGVPEALRLGQQVAQALEAAHENGVIHRDLKPANILITEDDTVKVVDFGLAKAFSDDSVLGTPDSSLSPTLTSAGTVAGMILGTAAYMSPEQAKGKAVDRKADVWAFGAVLYEMLTGRKAFEGEVVSETLASVLKTAPDWSALPGETPPALRRLLERCLEKDPRQRMRDIGDARIAIDDLRSGRFEETEVAAATGPQPGSGLMIAGAAVVALLLGALGAWFLKPAPPLPAHRQLEVAVAGSLPLFYEQGSSVALSPDGDRLAFITGLASDTATFRLNLRPLDRLESTEVAGTGSAYNPFFSPDGQWVGFATPNELKKVAVTGGTPLTLCQLSLSRGATWGEEGTIVFAPSPASGLQWVPAAGGTPEPLTELAEGETSHRWPYFLPGGTHVLFTSYSSNDRNAGRIEVVEVKSGKRTVVHQGGTYPHYVESGHLLFANNGTLFAAPMNPRTLALSSLPAPVLPEIAINTEGGAMYDVARDGTLVYLTGQASGAQHLLRWFNVGGQSASVTEAAREYVNARLSPDNRQLAVELVSEGNRDIWVYDLERNTQTRLTFSDGREFNPAWSPDGKWIYYGSASGATGIFRKRTDGSGAEELVVTSEEGVLMVPYSVSPDGRYLAYHDQGAAGDLWILPLDGASPPEPLFESQSFEGDPVFSPDGRWISYDADDSGEWEVYVRPFPGPGGKWQISAEGGEFARWSADGRKIFYRNRDGGIWSVDVDGTGESFQAGRPVKVLDLPPEYLGDWDVSSDGTRFLVIQQGGASGASGPNTVKFAFNWFGELEHLLATGR
jgi:Tol biopolymer transport system component